MSMVQNWELNPTLAVRSLWPRTAPQQLPRIPILICLKTIPATGRAGSIGLWRCNQCRWRWQWWNCLQEIGLEPGLWIRDSWQNLQTHFQKHKMNVVRVFAPFSQQPSLPNFWALSTHCMCSVFFGHKSIVMVRSWNLLRSKMLKFKTWTVWCTQHSNYFAALFSYHNHTLSGTIALKSVGHLKSTQHRCRELLKSGLDLTLLLITFENCRFN